MDLSDGSDKIDSACVDGIVIPVGDGGTWLRGGCWLYILCS